MITIDETELLRTAYNNKEWNSYFVVLVNLLSDYFIGETNRSLTVFQYNYNKLDPIQKEKFKEFNKDRFPKVFD